MKIEAGKRYIMRNGEVTSKLQPTKLPGTYYNHYGYVREWGGVSKVDWQDNGNRYHLYEDQHDIVAEFEN